MMNFSEVRGLLFLSVLFCTVLTGVHCKRELKYQTSTDSAEEDQFSSEGYQSLLGKSLYVPTEDLLGAIPNGITFLKDISQKCYRKMKHKTTVKDQTFYRNTEQFYKSVVTKTNLHVGFESEFTLGFTLDATTKSVSGSNRSVSGTSLNLVTKSFELQFTSDCLYESDIQGRIFNDFVALRTEISKPWLKDSWRDYDAFLRTHGSHVITAVTYGSSVQQFAFAKESSSYKAKEFTVKACASLAGNVNAIMNLSISACANVNKADVRSVSDAEMTSTITVRGGTIETRYKLLYERSKELILKFLEEGNKDPSPIEFKLTPIWQVLNGQKQVQKENPNRRAQSSNMQYYFDGFLSFGCSYIPAGERGPIIQKFDHAEHSTPEHPVYHCSLAPPGCHSDRDCHHRLGFKCACYGKSCIRHEVVELSSGRKKTTAAPYVDKKDWLWQGCGWKVRKIKCGCKDENKKRKVIFSNRLLEKRSRMND